MIPASWFVRAKLCAEYHDARLNYFTRLRQRLQASGLSREDARLGARRSFGG
jgi:hypothetical protein